MRARERAAAGGGERLYEGTALSYKHAGYVKAITSHIGTYFDFWNKKFHKEMDEVFFQVFKLAWAVYIAARSRKNNLFDCRRLNKSYIQ